MCFIVAVIKIKPNIDLMSLGLDIAAISDKVLLISRYGMRSIYLFCILYMETSPDASAIADHCLR